MESLEAIEYDTYDIESDLQDGQRIVDWYAVATYTGAASAITRLDASYSGHYSRSNVNQEVYLFNFARNQWDSIDTRTVGNDDNVTVTASIDTQPARYLSPEGELRLRVRGVRSSRSFYVWADQVKWEIFQTHPESDSEE